MHLLTAGQRRARAHRLVIGMAMGIAEGHDPDIVHGQEIEHRAQERRVGGKAAQIAFRRAGRAKERGEEIFIADKPGQRLQGQRFGAVGCHRHGERGSRVGKGFVNRYHQDWRRNRFARSKGSKLLGTVLIADGLATNRILLKARLAPMQYRVIQAETAPEAEAALREGPVSLVLAAAGLPGGGADAVAAAIRSAPLARRPGLIVLTDDADPALRRHHLRRGADDVLPRRIGDLILQARIRSLIRARLAEDDSHLGEATSRALGFAETPAGFAGQAQVALVCADAATAACWQSRLGPRVAAALRAHAFADTLGAVTRTPLPDVFVIGLTGARGRAGLRLLADLRARPATREAAVIALLDRPDGALAAEALDLGASDLMLGGFDAEELALRLAAQIASKRDRDRLRATMETGLRAAVIDPMTGLFNRRYALPHLAEALARTRHADACLTVMLADLDHFKRVNDLYGHAAGDAVLSEAARRLTAAVGGAGIVARVGGEEFLIVLPDTDESLAAEIGERLRLAVGLHPVRLAADGVPMRITVSIGVVVVRPADCAGAVPDGIDAQALIAMADRALYRAKGAGRNTVTAIRGAA